MRGASSSAGNVGSTLEPASAPKAAVPEKYQFFGTMKMPPFLKTVVLPKFPSVFMAQYHNMDVLLTVGFTRTRVNTMRA